MWLWLVALAALGGLGAWLRGRQLQELRRAFERAVQLHDSGDIPRAIERFEALQREGPRLFRAEVANRLARCYEATGHLDDAIAMCHREGALLAGPRGHHQARVAARHDLALLYHKKGDLPRALERCREALALGRQHLGPQHPEVALAEKNLAELVLALDQPDEAQGLLLHSMESLSLRFGPEDPDVVAIRRRLLQRLEQRGQPTSLRLELLQRELAYVRKHLGHLHPEALGEGHRLASLLCAREMWTEARLLYEQLLPQVQAAALKPEQRLAFLLQAAEFYRGQDEPGTAEPLYRQALEMSLEEGDELRPQILNNLGAVRLKMGHLQEAEELYKQSLALARERGAQREVLAPALHNLASLVTTQGQHQEAEELLGEAAALYGDDLPPAPLQRGLSQMHKDNSPG